MDLGVLLMSLTKLLGVLALILVDTVVLGTTVVAVITTLVVVLFVIFLALNSLIDLCSGK